MEKVYKFNRNYLDLLIANKDKLIEVPINDVRLILTYCQILLERQDKAIEYIEENCSEHGNEESMWFYRTINADNVLNILKGDDKE